MQRIRIGAGVALILAGITVSPSSAWAADERTNGLQIGMVQGMFRDIQPGVVQAMSIPLRDLIRKQTGLTGDVEIAPDAFTLADRLKTQRYHLGVFHGFEFAWVRKQHPNLVPLVVTVPPGGQLQACIVVQKDSKASSFTDLDSICMHRGMKAHCLAYLEKTETANAKKLKTKASVTAEESLDSLISGDSQAAMVDISALSGYRSLQPGAFNQLRVLCQSESFPQTVIVYNKGSVNQDTASRVRKLLTEANKTAAGKPLMMLWSLKGFDDVPADYDTQLERIAKGYPTPPAPLPVRPAVGMAPEEK